MSKITVLAVAIAAILGYAILAAVSPIPLPALTDIVPVITTILPLVGGGV